MSAEETRRPRRSRGTDEGPEMPSGWRTSRRGSKAAKKARKDIKRHVRKEAVERVATRTKRTVRDVAYLTGLGIAGLLAVVAVLYVLALGINGLARWNAERLARAEDSPEAQAEKAKDNLLLIAVDGDRATGFLALRHDAEAEQIYGIAIPDGAFIEVPGQGFERVGDSYAAGTDVSLAAVSNFFTVPFHTYAVIDSEIYQSVMTNLSLVGVAAQFDDTNLEDDARERWSRAFDGTSVENIALVPMPVKAINLGNETYFEPQRAEVADLLESWWGVTIGDTEQVVRVIVYNGSGTPGIAGEAAQALIRGGFRVVDTKNADTFDYATTQIVVQNGDESTAAGITDILGVGEVTVQPADQQVADVIIIIGADYSPPGTTE